MHMGIPTCGNLWESVGFPVGFCEISCGFLWDFLWVSVRFPVGFCGISCGFLWEWEWEFHSHGNPGDHP